jgi:hypothetical protein
VSVARLWGCTPAQLRDVTWAEYQAMTVLLLQQIEATEGS